MTCAHTEQFFRGDAVRSICRCCWLLCLAIAAVGCTRTHYRLAADRETYGVLAEKTAAAPWQVPPGFDVQPDPGSRFYDPSAADDPELPIPSPQLYAYQLPELPPRDPARFRVAGQAPRLLAMATAGLQRLPPVEPAVWIDPTVRIDPFVQQASYQQEMPPGDPAGDPAGGATGAELRVSDPFVPEGPVAEQPGGPDAGSSDALLRVVPIPAEVWESLPASCLRRMFEFESVREEYDRTFRRQPTADQRDRSQRLALEDIIELALINSREYQAEKEALYETALILTLVRFGYDLKFSTEGNSTGAGYSHNRSGGKETVNELGIPTAIRGDKLLATGGMLVAKFANEVVLKFNEPEGFVADIGSDLALSISQTVFQRDDVLEGLTRAERAVVYAARDFARARKELFATLARDYYELILVYRGIEIGAQDYFSKLRAFHQGEAEYRETGSVPRREVDQFEQQALASRSGLIGDCNLLEDRLDQLKVSIGLPPELPLNLDLTELEQLTLRDEATVSAERIQRARRNLVSLRQQAGSDQRGVLLNGATDLAQRMLHLARLRQRLGHEDSDIGALELLLAQLSADEVRLLVRDNRDYLAQELRAKPPAPPLRIFQRTMDLADSLLVLVQRQLELAQRISADRTAIAGVQRQWLALVERLAQVGGDLEQAVAQRQLDLIDPMRAKAEALLVDVDALARDADRLTKVKPLTAEEELQQTLRHADRLLAESQQMLSEETGGLVPVELEMDDAMLTALVQRFDLMNERGSLADTWRSIKLAGDDLKSVLNLSATQTVGTKPNRPFGFTFDEGETSLSLALDTPLNRKSQRNAFRLSLIDYQVALRNLMALEDGVKLSIRGDLRGLQLGREQYRIAVASAALAYERVISTRLQLQLGMEGVTARDFLEAQQAYTRSLNDVAREHIFFIRGRIQLFMDLELLQVDEKGFWPELYNEAHQPAASFQLPGYARPAYGELPDRVCHSRRIKRMLEVPTGYAEVYGRPPDGPPEHGPPDEAPLPEEVPAPEPEGP